VVSAGVACTGLEAKVRVWRKSAKGFRDHHRWGVGLAASHFAGQIPSGVGEAAGSGQAEGATSAGCPIQAFFGLSGITAPNLPLSQQGGCRELHLAELCVSLPGSIARVVFKSACSGQNLSLTAYQWENSFILRMA
jgi:hypothetical protein